MFNDFFENLKEELQKDLPGEKAQTKMAPSVRSLFKSNEKSRKAAVLIMLYPKNDILHLAFIQRSEYDGPHSGQISFPGGKYEEKDRNIIETALRESKEEIGIDPEKINIYGQLTPLQIPISNFIVHPVVGTCNTTPLFKADTTEVEKIIEISLKDLINSNNCTTKEFNYGERKFIAPIYCYNNITIWGATAMILSEFIEIIQKSKFTFQV